MATATETAETPRADLSEFISAEQLAEALGVKLLVIGVWRREKKLPAIRLGSRTFFFLPSVVAWLRSLEAVHGAAEDTEDAE